MTQIIEECRSCGSYDLEWHKDKGWLTGSVRYLRCRMCSDCIRVEVGARPVGVGVIIPFLAERRGDDTVRVGLYETNPECAGRVGVPAIPNAHQHRVAGREV